MDRIDVFLAALEHAALIEGDIVPWPISVAGVAPYFSDEEARYMYEKAQMLSQQGVPAKRLGELLPGPTAVKTTLLDAIIGLKVPDEPIITADERIWYVNYIFDVLEKMQAGDIFCRDGTNQILTPGEAANLYEQTSWQWLGERQDFGRLAQKVSTSALSLIWSLYFYAWPNVGFEIHGPYRIAGPDGTEFLLLVRDFFDIKPTLLWKSMEQFPYESVRTLTLYRQETDLSVDIYNHLLHKSNLLDSTVAVCVEANGQPLQTAEGIDALRKELTKAILSQNQLVSAMNTEEVTVKFIESRYYVYRKVRAYFGDDWYPPARVLGRIERWGLINIPPSGGPDWQTLKAAFDPRTDVMPGKS